MILQLLAQCNSIEASVDSRRRSFPTAVLSEALTRTNHRSLTTSPKKAEKAPKSAPKSFENLFLRVSPLFYQFAIGSHQLTARKLLILLEGVGRGWE